MVTSIFEAIGRMLAAAAVDPVAALLPDPLAESLRRAAASPELDEPLVELAECERVSLGAGKEHVQVVLEQLATSIAEPERVRLAALLPDELASWLVPWQPPPERRERAPVGRERTLASGRPGSEHPLSEAGPARGQHESLAVSDDPHADTRLSSTRGITSERSHTTLADGRPGSERPVSEGRD